MYNMYIMYLADQTARLCAGESNENADYYRTNACSTSSSLVNKARILSVSAPHAGSWISTIPSTGLDLHLDSAC